MVGLPLFNLGGVFHGNNIINAIYSVSGTQRNFVDLKAPESVVSGSPISALLSPIAPFAAISDRTTRAGPWPMTWPPSYDGNTLPRSGNLSFTTIGTNYPMPLKNSTDGPIISNISCSVGQQGVTTTYSFRTYTKKLGLFNREAI